MFYRIAHIVCYKNIHTYPVADSVIIYIITETATIRDLESLVKPLLYFIIIENIRGIISQ